MAAEISSHFGAGFAAFSFLPATVVAVGVQAMVVQAMVVQAIVVQAIVVTSPS